MTLPTNDADRKALPVFDGTWGYFPDALVEVAHVSKVGNDQHNPGEPLHWARGKSMDQMNTALRHMIDHNAGNVHDTDGTYHLAKAAWRILAQLQLVIEGGRAEKPLIRASGWAEGPSGIEPGDKLTVAPVRDPELERAAATIAAVDARRYTGDAASLSGLILGQLASNFADDDSRAFITVSCGSCGRIYELSPREHVVARMNGLGCTCGHITTFKAA
jgi:hypothetical protein